MGTETHPEDKFDKQPTVPKSEDVKIEAQEDIQTIQKTELMGTFDTVTAGVSSFESAKIDLLGEVTSKISTVETPKSDTDLNIEMTVEQDVAEKEARRLSLVTKSRTSSTSSRS